MNRLKEAMLLLIANDAPLGPEWLDHPLGGDWKGYRECHIGGDFLLIYESWQNWIENISKRQRNWGKVARNTLIS